MDLKVCSPVCEHFAKLWFKPSFSMPVGLPILILTLNVTDCFSLDQTPGIYITTFSISGRNIEKYRNWNEESSEH